MENRRKKSPESSTGAPKKRFDKSKKKEGFDRNSSPFAASEKGSDTAKPRFKKPFRAKTKSYRASSTADRIENKPDDGSVRLNKYIANAGICSRREADDLITSGVIQVNGKNITELGFKVIPTDIIKYGGQTLRKEKMMYLLLNKPKDYITTYDDPEKRKTVLELIQGACKERIYPVGRLDRNTTGLLLFTNDGELTKKLTHPRYGVRKVYQVELDKPLKPQDLKAIQEGIELEDGPIKADEVAYVGDGKSRTDIGIEIHSGRNRLVRRIFEHFGYNVRKLDRVMFGPLTKKDLPRGRWRFLSESEIGMLNMVSNKGA
jgi:23S rRNA pseudouridine2605 synthase